jgi:tRNA-Thr(GGU) m(6)t(6)A37 methyltransferase TsaA
MKLDLRPIGVINTPYKDESEAPIQSRLSEDHGTVMVFEEYKEGLEGIEDFSHIFLLFLFHRREGYSLKVRPFLDKEEKGLFATRAPARPNPIGLSVVELLERKGSILTFRGADIVNGTPLLDIKPYVPAFDCVEHANPGWLEGKV